MCIDAVLAATAKSYIDAREVDAAACRQIVAAAGRLTEAKIGVKQAAVYARRIMGCYRARDYVDPEMFTVALVSLLAEQPPIIADLITDPRGGLVSKNTFAPAIAEISDELQRLRRGLESAAWSANKALKIASTPPPAPERNEGDADRSADRSDDIGKLTMISRRMTGERE